MFKKIMTIIAVTMVGIASIVVVDLLIGNKKTLVHTVIGQLVQTMIGQLLLMELMAPKRETETRLIS